MLTFSFSDTTLLHSTLAMFLTFFHPRLILAETASCIPHPDLKISPRYKNFAIFFIASPFCVTYSSTSVGPLSIKSENQHIKITVYCNYKIIETKVGSVEFKPPLLDCFFFLCLAVR